jgi:SET domain-containing protein
MNITQQVIDHLLINVKTEIRPSPIHGIGVFAIKDIKKGEQLFTPWNNETGVYLIANNIYENFPEKVKILLHRYFINEECGFKVIRLFKGMNLICHAISFCNSAYPNKENENIDINGVALRDIKEGEEILEWYTENIYLENSK